MCLRAMLFVLAIVLCPIAWAHDVKPLKVLWCTGGGWHDYKGQTKYLTAEIAKRANVQFTILDKYKEWGQPGFADKYDVVVFFFSYHDKEAKDVVANIAKTVHDGKPTVFIHGILHSFREHGKGRDNLTEAIGITSSNHDAYRPLILKKVAKHPIIDFCSEEIQTPGEELYTNAKVWPNVTPLMTTYSVQSKKDHIVTWVNQYGKGKVFGTSLGHDMKTMGLEFYPRMLTNGILWVCDKLDNNGRPKEGYGK